MKNPNPIERAKREFLDFWEDCGATDVIITGTSEAFSGEIILDFHDREIDQRGQAIFDRGMLTITTTRPGKKV